jgi:hypothetical protein
VTRDLSELLRAAADDRDRPLPFTAQDIIRRGRSRMRRRAWGWTSLWAAAAVALIIVLSQLTTRSERPPFPAPAPATTSATTASTPPPSTSTTSTAPVVSELDAKLIAECATTVVYAPQSVSVDAMSLHTTFPEPHPTTSDLTGWRVLLRADDQFGTSAGLVSADGTRYVACNRVHDSSTDTKDDLHDMRPPTNSPVPSSWTDPANAYLVDMFLGWSQICQTTPRGKVCPDELYYGVAPVYDGVTRVRIEWPDKTAADYPVTNGYYVARHVEKRVERPVDPKVREGQIFPSIYISFYDAAGKLLIRYDHNPSMPIPATCPTDRGC